ncbi:UNVERIFIED_CONTAM: hypothetical protein Slati_0866000 [Sesamum latifolium]|uniref:DUF4283 domain-containing protein n=1 Tax=Sesamum latifolium TaxID=2727402 RepID=A0AAW2XN13_9LAMI
MDSPNSLSSLSHTTPHTHTHPPAPNPCTTAADDDPIRGDALVVADVNGGTSPTVPRPCDFNLTEFLALASRVVDDGDAESWLALHSLKQRWVAKFGDGGSSTPTGGLKSVSTHAPTPFPLPMRAPRRALRTITAPISRVSPRDSTPPLPLTTGDLLPEVPPSASPHAAVETPPTAVDDAPPPRALEVTAAPTVHGLASPRPSFVVGGPSSCTGGAAASFGSAPTAKMMPPPLYVGKAPITPTPHTVDAIVDAFHNSTRKTLSYIPPTLQNGEVIVRPSLDIIRSGSQRWTNTAVGYFLGRRPYFHHVNEYVRSVWPIVREVMTTSNGFFLFQFKMNAAMEEVIEGGPWLFQGQPIVLQKWEPGMVLRKLQHTQVPVWIKLHHLPVELWTTEGLSTVASGIGKPLYPDAITRACTRLDFARVCIMLDISSKLLKHIVIMVPREDGSEVPCKVDVEYEWLPPKCIICMTLGHSSKGCPTKKPRQPPVSVYVPKSVVGTQEPREELRDEPAPSPTPVVPTTAAPAPAVGTISMDREDKGKAIILYNAFEVLMESDSPATESKGPISSPTSLPDD